MAQPVKYVKSESSLDIVPMSYAHIEEVLDIERRAFSNPWRRNDFEYALDRSNGYAVVAYQSTLMVGYAVGFFMRREFHLASLAVHDCLRRRGIGTALLSRVIDSVKERGTSVITLEVRMSNAGAIALYEKAGFCQIAVRQDYYTRPREDALVMIKTLRDDPWS